MGYEYDEIVNDDGKHDSDDDNDEDENDNDEGN